MRSPFVEFPYGVPWLSSETATALLLPKLKCLTKMENQVKTAGQTAQTKPAWGIVAIIGVMVAVTMGDNLIMAAIGTVMLAAGAYLGGYMAETCTELSKNLGKPAEVEERRAA